MTAKLMLYWPYDKDCWTTCLCASKPIHCDVTSFEHYQRYCRSRVPLLVFDTLEKVIKSVKCHFSIYSTSINCYVQCFTLHIKGVCWPRTLLIKTFKLLSISIPEFLQPITQFTYYAHVAFCLIMCHFLFYNFSFFFCQIVFHTVSDPLSHSSTCLLVGQNIS